MVGSKMHSLHPVNASHGRQATRTHSTAWLTSKPTGNSWRPHGPVEVGWCLGWSTCPWVLEISSKFFQWYESPHLSSHSSHSFPQVPLSYKNSEIFDFTDCDEWNREVKFPVLLREGLIGNRGVDSWVKGTNCHAGWVGVYCWYSNKSSITHWFWGFWVRKNPLVREGKNKTLTPASASPFRYIPIYSLAIPCMLHSPTFGTV